MLHCKSIVTMFKVLCEDTLTISCTVLLFILFCDSVLCASPCSPDNPCHLPTLILHSNPPFTLQSLYSLLQYILNICSASLTRLAHRPVCCSSPIGHHFPANLCLSHWTSHSGLVVLTHSLVHPQKPGMRLSGMQHFCNPALPPSPPSHSCHFPCWNWDIMRYKHG